MRRENMTLVEVISITIGTYFGECLGYCNEEIFISKNGIYYTISASIERNDTPPIAVDIPIENEEWIQIARLVDLQSFNDLPIRIGCPDCADQGGEFITISDGITQKRVDFEFDSSVPELESLLSKLREIRIRLYRKYKPQ
jgi:hypothetical protein